MSMNQTTILIMDHHQYIVPHSSPYTTSQSIFMVVLPHTHQKPKHIIIDSDEDQLHFMCH